MRAQKRTTVQEAQEIRWRRGKKGEKEERKRKEGRRRWESKGCGKRKAQEKGVMEELLSLLALILHSLSQERRSQRLKWKFILYFRSLERADRILREDFSPSICL